MSMPQWWKVVAVLVVAGATASGVEWVGAGDGPGPQDPTVKRDQAVHDSLSPSLEVKPGRVRLALTQRGFVEASRSTHVLCNVEGQSTIIKIVPEGQQVKAGQVVCELDSAALKDQLINQVIKTKSVEAGFIDARRMRELAEISLREYTEGVFVQELQALGRAKEASRAAVRKLDERLDRTRKASDRLKAALDAAGRAKAPAEIVAELDLLDRIDDIERSRDREQSSLIEAEGREHLLRNYTSVRTKGALEGQVKKAHADELAKQAAWELEMGKEDKLRKMIDGCRIIAPKDGVVVYANDPSRMWGNQRQIEEGATVRERQKILSIINLDDPMRINVKVPENLVKQVAPKMKVRVKVDAFADQTYNGLVSEIAPLPDASYMFATAVKVYTTRVQIGGGHPGLRPGMTATAEIILDEGDDRITVQVQAVAHYDGQDHVAVRKPDGGIEWRTVVLGPSDGSVVVIKEGLKGGEPVVLDAEPLLTDAQRVRRDAVIDPMPEKPAAPERPRRKARPGR